MVVHCTVCMNNTRKNKNISYFNYPKESTRRHEWLKAVGREDLLKKLADSKTRQQYRICEDHFDTTCIKFSKNRTVKYLHDNAFPKLKLPTNDGAWLSSSHSANAATNVYQDIEVILTFETSSRQSGNCPEPTWRQIQVKEDEAENMPLKRPIESPGDTDSPAKIPKAEDDDDGADEFDLFCRSLAVQLKRMPLDRAVVCQERLQAVMSAERLRQLQGAASSEATPSADPETFVPVIDFIKVESEVII